MSSLDASEMYINNSTDTNYTIYRTDTNYTMNSTDTNWNNEYNV